MAQKQRRVLMITAATKSEHDHVLPTLLMLLDIDSHAIHPELNMLVSCANL
ncbi:hypothetical protein [Acinetobacter brisouii]|uniref:hypothetical protein n=1 Tax=Acinetobacter brisouii TaxID=396323 RepID=UPI0012DB5CCC|nr:hypothetical protein [Acinetobacter brisouii]